MARTVAAIEQEILNNIAADGTLSGLSSTSKTAIYRLLAYVVAVSIWILETLFDNHKSEVEAILATKQTHNKQWYANKAKAFQYGYELPDDSDVYAVIDDAAMIIAQASVTESNGSLIMKVAKLTDGELGPLSTASPDEITPFATYVGRFKDAGVKVDIISTDGDDLRLVMDMFYDPLILDENGVLLSDGETEPGKDAIKSFIRSLPFNGEFIPTSLVDLLQVTPGIQIPVILSCETKYAGQDWMTVDGKVIPFAGYLNIADENLTINYRPNA